MLVFTQRLETAEEHLRIEQVFHTYGKLMFHVANGVLNNQHDAEDAVQQALLAVCGNLDKFSEIKCPQTRSFIVTIVERKAIDLYRAKQRNAALPLEEGYANVSATSQIEAAADKTDLARAMAALPARYRELLFLKYDSGYSEREISVMLSMTEANVKKTIHRAKKKLEWILNGQEA